MCKVQIKFGSGKRLGSYLSFKDKVPLNARSLILYKFLCGGCKSAYLGKSKRHFLVRIFEYLDKSLATGNTFMYNPKNSNNTAVLNHINCKNCESSST